MPNEKKFPVSLVIGAVDRVTSKIRAINSRVAGLAARLTQPFAGLQNSVLTLGGELGFGALGRSLSNVHSKTGRVLAEASKLATKLGAIATLGAYAGYRLLRDFAGGGDAATDAAQGLGLAIQDYLEISKGAELTGINPEVFQATFERFSKGIGEAAAGTGSAADAFAAMRISIRDSSGQLRTIDSLLPEVAEKLSRVRDANVRNALGAKIFGKQFSGLRPFLKDGAKGVAAYRAEAKRLGDLNEEQIKRGDALFTSFARMGQAIGGIRNRILSSLAPAITGVLARFENFIVNNREQIGAWADDFAGKLPDRVETLGRALSRIGEAARPFIAIGRFIVSKFGLANTVMTVAAVMMGGKFLLAVGALSQALFGLNFNLAATLVRFGAMAGGSILGFASNLLMFFKYLRAGIPLVQAFNLLLYTNPIAMAVTGVAALAAGAYLLYKNWKPVMEWLGGWLQRLQDAWPNWLRPGGGVITGPRMAGAASSGGATSSPGASLLGPSAGAQRFIEQSQSTSTKVTRQEATVKLQLGDLPRGSRVESSSTGGIPLDVSWGYGMGAPK